MKSLKIKSILLLIITLLTIITSCSSESDPGGQFFWTIIGLPLLGVAYFIGGVVISKFQSEEEKSKTDSPEPVPSIIVGVIVMGVIYVLFKAIF